MIGRKTAHDLSILRGGLLAVELNTVHDLMIFQGGLLAAELNTDHDFEGSLILQVYWQRSYSQLMTL